MKSRFLVCDVWFHVITRNERKIFYPTDTIYDAILLRDTLAIVIRHFWLHGLHSFPAMRDTNNLFDHNNQHLSNLQLHSYSIKLNWIEAATCRAIRKIDLWLRDHSWSLRGFLFERTQEIRWIAFCKIYYENSLLQMRRQNPRMEVIMGNLCKINWEITRRQQQTTTMTIDRSIIWKILFFTHSEKYHYHYKKISFALKMTHILLLRTLEIRMDVCLRFNGQNFIASFRFPNLRNDMIFHSNKFY